MKCQLKKMHPPTPLYPPAPPHSLSIVSLVEDLFTVFILYYPEECSAVVDVFLLSEEGHMGPELRISTG